MGSGTSQSKAHPDRGGGVGRRAEKPKSVAQGVSASQPAPGGLWGTAGPRGFGTPTRGLREEAPEGVSRGSVPLLQHLASPQAVERAQLVGFEFWGVARGRGRMEGGRQAGVEETGVGRAPRLAPAAPPPPRAWYPATSPLPEAASRTRELAALSAGRPCWPREARSRPSTVAAVPASRQRRVRAGRGAGWGRGAGLISTSRPPQTCPLREPREKPGANRLLGGVWRDAGR